MNQIIIVLCAVLAVAYGNARVDDYVKLNQLQYQQVLSDYDAKLNNFKQHYQGRVEAVTVQKQMVVTSLVQFNERLNPLLLVSSHTKQCVLKYRSRMETVDAKTAITTCALTATNQLSTLIIAPLETRNALKDYIVNHYETEVKNCGYDTACVSAVTTETNAFVYDNQKAFEFELEAAECIAKANVKKAIDCSYTIQYDVLSQIGEVSVLIDDCIIGADECKPCEEFTCSENYSLVGDNQTRMMDNPLYGRTDNPTCLMLSYE